MINHDEPLFYRGTTPSLIFEMPFDASLIVEGFVTLTQMQKVVVEKQREDFEINGNVVTVRLTQEETLSLNSRFDVEIQIRGRTVYGDAFTSYIYRDSVGRILKEGVI